MTNSLAAAAEYGLQRITMPKRNGGPDPMLFDKFGVVGNGGNGGYQLTNLVAQAGVAAIALVGFDMNADRGVHWHGKHAGGLNNPQPSNLASWRATFDDAAHRLAQIGIDVVNCSDHSSLKAFRRASLEEFLNV